MRKVLLGMCLMLMTVLMFSCSKANPEETLKGLVEQVKAEGSKWDVAKWKSVVMEAFDAIKPMAEEMKSLAVEAEKDPSKIADIMKLGEKNAAVQKLFSELMGEVEKSSVAAELENDPDVKAMAASLEMD